MAATKEIKMNPTPELTVKALREISRKLLQNRELPGDQILPLTVTDVAAQMEATTKTYSSGLVDGSQTERRALCREIDPAIELIRIAAQKLTLNAPGDAWARECACELMSAHAILSTLE